MSSSQVQGALPPTQDGVARSSKASPGRQGGEREVSRSNLLGRHQDSSLFRNMVQDNVQKYDNRVKLEAGGQD